MLLYQQGRTLSTPFLNFSRIICTNFRQGHASGFWGAGLCGWNCCHTFFALFPELGDPPAWTRDQLEELNARNIEYNGKQYTRYEINQMQRARERNVRRWKKRYLAETEAGVDTTDSAVRLKAARQSLAEFAQATGGCVDSARVSVPKFGRSEGSKAAWAARNVKKSDSSTLLQKLNFTDSVPQPERESIETESSILPQWQRDRAESLIDKVVLTDSSASGSGYDYRSRTLYVHPDHSAGDMIHEYGHALEISLDLRHNQKYIEVRRSGLDLSDLSKVVLDSGTYTEYVQYLTCDKFISTYQGRLYESPDYGIFKKDSSEIDEAMLKEYFSEGFRAFYKEPALLKEKDPKPYEFIEGLSDDQK